MKAVDDAVLAKLRAVAPPINGVDRVHEVKVPSTASTVSGEETVVIVESPIPFLIYAPDAGRHVNRRHTGRAGVVPNGFRVVTAAAVLGDVQTVNDAVVGALADQLIPVTGRKPWRVRFDDSDEILPDPNTRLSDGQRLLRGVLRFTLAVIR